MPMLFTCPHCGHHTNVDDSYAGQTGPCVMCGQQITVPATPQATPAKAPSSDSGGPWGRLWTAIGAALVLAVLAASLAILWKPTLTSARESVVRAQCCNNLKQLGLAMHNYHAVHNRLPRAAGEAPDGPAYRSWRVAILPFIEQPRLYDQFNFDEPWDSEHNLSVAEQLSPENCPFVCPSDELRYRVIKGHMILCTNYVMVTGPQSAGQGGSFAEFTDGTSNTLMIVEVTGDDCPAWCEPVDLSIEDLRRGINGRHGAPSIGSPHPDGAHVVLCDGAVRFLDQSFDPEVLCMLGTRDGGEEVAFSAP